MLHNATPHYDNGKYSSQPEVAQKSHICIKNQSCKPCSQSENCCPTISHYDTPFHYDSFSMLAGLSISYHQPKEHPYMSELSLFSAYVRTGHVRTYAEIDLKRAIWGCRRKRQDTTAMVIPCLSSFLLTVLRTPAVELPVNKKRTRTLSHKESGSSTNCMVEN